MSTNNKIYKIQPIFVERIWGGTNLKKFNFEFDSKTIGEAWLISGYKNFESKIENENLTLNEFYKKNKQEFGNYPTNDFPLLVKLLDATQDLSVQIHPDDQQAMKLENYPFGKSECWYVVDKQKGSKMIIGLNKPTNESEIRNFLKDGKWNSIYKTIKSKKDLALNITPGTIHAIGAGNLIYELQQSSDLTYRFYDFDRVDDKGNKRELHLEKAISVVSFEKKQFSQKKKVIFKDKSFKKLLIVNNENFNLEIWETKDSKHLIIDKDHFFLLITNLWETTTINSIEIKKGESVIVPTNSLGNINLSKGKLLVGYPKQVK